MVENLSKKKFMNDQINSSLPVNTEPSIDISQLKTIKNIQHSSAILNNPEFSFINEFKNKFARKTSLIPKDLDSLSQTIDSPRSIRSFKSEKPKTNQRLLTETFDEYLTKIEKLYPVFKKNHYINYDQSSKLNSTIQEISNNNDDYKGLRTDLQRSEFFVQNYKIPDKFLNLKIEDIFGQSETLTEKCGDLDFEMNFLLFNSKKLFDYIIDNYGIESDVEIFLEKVKRIKAFNKSFKNKIVLNSLNSFKLGTKKTNLMRILRSFREIKFIKENINDLIKLLDNVDKRSEFFDLYYEIANSIEILKSEGDLDILLEDENEINEAFSSFSNKVYNEFIDLTNEILESCLDSKEILIDSLKTIELNDEYFESYSAKFNLDIRIFKNSAILKTVLSIFEFQILNNESVKFKKLTEIFSYALRIDWNIINKLKQIIFNFFKDVIKSLIEKLDHAFTISYEFHNFILDPENVFSSLSCHDKGLYIVLLNQIFRKLFDNYSYILNMMKESSIDFIPKINSSLTQEQCIELKNHFNQETQNTLDSSLNEYILIVDQYIKYYIQNEAKSEINSFIIAYNIVTQILNSDTNLYKGINYTELIKILESETIEFFSHYIQLILKSVEDEDWKESAAPKIYQKIVTFIEDLEIDKLKNSRTDEIFLYLNTFEEYENENEHSSIQTNDGNSHKILKSSLEIVKFFYQCLKIMYFLDSKLSDIVCQKLTKTTKEYVIKCSNMILASEAFKIKKITINQNNICLLISSMIFLNRLIVPISKSMMMVATNQANKYVFEDLESSIEKIVSNGKKKLFDICFDQINQPFIQTEEFEWYTESSESLKKKAEIVFNKQKSIYTICQAIKKYLPPQTSEELITSICSSLVESYHKFLNILNKVIEVKNNAKQLRSLLAKVNKLLESIGPKDIGKYLSVFDEYINKFAPRSKNEGEEKKKSEIEEKTEE